MKTPNPHEKDISICPFGSAIKLFEGRIISPLKDIIHSLLNYKEEYTPKYGIQYLDIRNVRKERKSIYEKINVSELYEHSKSGGSIYKYCIDKGFPFYIIQMGIESEFAIIVWKKLMNQISLINIMEFQPKTNNLYQESSDYLITLLAKSAQKIINNISNSKELTREQIILELISGLSKDLGESGKITNKITNLLFRDGIENTVKFATDNIYTVNGYNKINVLKTIEMLKNSKSLLSSLALSNIPLFYIMNNSKKSTHVYDEENNKVKSPHTKLQFKIFSKISKVNYKKEGGGEYSGCPLLFEKYKINGKSENGIIAYEIKLTEILCDLINHGKKLQEK